MNSLDSTVVSTRIRLARNVKGMPFPHKLNKEGAALITERVADTLAQADRFIRYDIKSLSPLDAIVLREKHLISPDLAEDSLGSALISSDETISVMVNEEDHIREQAIMQGLALDQAYSKIDYIDDILSKKIEFAYDGRFGYLTSCATNLGTGMRASVMMFLPALTVTNGIESYIAGVGRLNMTVRGVYGEGSKSEGYLYQISNQHTLGVRESDILAEVKSGINMIAEGERRAREALKRDEPSLKDKIYRAWGTATNAYKLSTSEAMQLLAFVRLGGYYGYLNISDEEAFQQIITGCQPAHMQKAVGTADDSDARDIMRARYVATSLSRICNRNNI